MFYALQLLFFCPLMLPFNYFGVLRLFFHLLPKSRTLCIQQMRPSYQSYAAKRLQILNYKQ